MAMRRLTTARAVIVALASLSLVVGLLAALVMQKGSSTTEVRATPGTTWLSDEIHGQVVLAAAGGDRASVSVPVGGGTDVLDVIDVGQSVFVHNRTAGELIRLSGIDGELKQRTPAPAAASGPTELVRAGSAVYLVDQTKSAAQRIDANGQALESVTLGSFTSWVGTDDGRLWLVDSATGNIITFDGQLARTSRVVQLGADAVLTAIAGDPVLIDRTNNRLRWLRRGVTFEPDVALTGALVQQPSARGTCLQVVTKAELRCYSSKRQERSLPLDSPVTADQQLFVNERNALITSSSSTKVLVGSWRTRTWSTAERPAPSSRLPVAWSNPGPLLVDDPGSRYAITADNARLIVMDKFSRLTVVGEDSKDGSGVAIAPNVADDPTQNQVLATQIEREKAKANGGPNLPPTPQPDRVITRSGRSVQVAVLANDTDPNGDILAVSSVGPLKPGEGKAVVSAGQIVTYTPPDRFVGQITFPYTVTDPGNLKATSTVTVDVLGGDRNTPPRLNDDSARTPMNTGVTIDVLSNDRDDEGDPLTITETSTPSHGTISLRPEGIRFDPTAGFVGVDEFTYTAIDGYNGKASASVRVTVVAPPKGNRAPLAVDDRAAAHAGKKVSIPVLLNDVDPDGDQIHVVDVTEAAGLTLTITNGGQSIDAQPAANVSGPTSFTYTIEDTGGLRSSATVILLVDQPIAENRAPEAADDRATSAFNPISIDVLANDTDPDGDVLTITDFTQPAAGHVIKTSGRTFRFEPPANQPGTQIFTYTVSDPGGLKSTAKVTIEVIAPTRSGPVARDDAATVFPGDTVVIKPTANDSHPDGLSFALVGVPVGRGADIHVNADESLSFTPPDATLTTYIFTYTIQDTAGKTASAQIAITVVAKPVVNRAPVANDDRFDAAFNQSITLSVTANDTDPDNEPVILTDVSGVSNGSATISGNSIVFTPTPQFSGLASLTYTISDAAGLKSTAKVIIQVANRPKQPPIAVNDALVSIGGVRVSIDPLVNDSDPDGAAAALVVQSATAESASVTVGVAPRLVTIQPPAAPGTYRVNYIVVDPDGLTATATIIVTVQSPPNQPPVAMADAVDTPYGVAVTIPVLSNDTDPDGGRLTITEIGPVSPSGIATLATAGIRYAPAPGFAGTATFTYTISDPAGATSTATVVVNVLACSAAAPDLTNDTASTKLNMPVSINLFANDALSTGTFALTSADRGSVAQTGLGQVTYRPPTDFSGQARFGYSVTNACGVIATASVVVTVNHPPTAVDDIGITVTSGQNVSIPVLANDGDPDGDPIFLFSVSNVSGGTAAITGSTVTFTPTTGYSGPASFSYTIRDPGNLPATAQVSISVLSANDPPVAKNDSATTVMNTTINSVDVLSNDSDANGDTLSVTSVSTVSAISTLSGTSPGSVSLVGANISYTPGTDFTGVASFMYTIADGHGGTAMATVTITVTAPVPVNKPPVIGSPIACNQTLGTTSFTCGLTSNATDPDGDTITLASVDSVTSSAVGGVISFSSSGNSVTVVLNPIAIQFVTISYTISDGHGHTASGTAGANIA